MRMRVHGRCSGLCCGVMLGIAAFLLANTVRWAHAQGPSPEREQKQIAVLRSNAPGAEKAIACKQLAIEGSSEAVPELAKLLADPQLASWARIALEAIPGPAADESLRKATDSLAGVLLVGTINSIGVRRDPGAVEILVKRLRDQDVSVASAAAVALGQIGNPAAAAALRKSLPMASATGSPVLASAVAEGCVLCAERLLSAGKSADAAAVYDDVRRAKVPQQRIVEATRGAILAKQSAGIPILLEQLRSPQKELFNIALVTLRELPGGEVDAAMVAEIQKTPPERAALMIQAMADRPKTAGLLPALIAQAQRGPKPVRLAALNALSRVGDASCFVPLLEIGRQGDPELAQAAMQSIADLPGEAVNAAIVAKLATPEGQRDPLVIEVIGRRGIVATAALLPSLEHPEPRVRSAALTALGETVELAELPVLIATVVAAKHPEDAQVAEKALKSASVRMPDREACATALASAVERSPSVPTQVVLLQIVGAVGGTKALETVGAAAKKKDPLLQDACSRLLGEWMTVDAAPVLLDLSKTAEGEKYQVRAQRGYIRIARQFVLPEKERAEMCRQALAVSSQTAEKKLVLEILKRYPNLDSLTIAINAIGSADVKDEATEAARAIGGKLSNSAEAKALLTKAGIN